MLYSTEKGTIGSEGCKRICKQTVKTVDVFYTYETEEIKFKKLDIFTERIPKYIDPKHAPIMVLVKGSEEDIIYIDYSAGSVQKMFLSIVDKSRFNLHLNVHSYTNAQYVKT